MRKLLLLLLAVSAGLHGQSGAPALTEAQIRELFTQVADQDLKNDKMARDYTYVEREEEHKLDGKGRVKSTETRTYETMELYGSQVRRLIAKNDHTLSGEEARKEEERIRKTTDKRANEDEGERAKREQRREKDREEGRQFVKEVSEAYNFKLVEEAELDGRATYVIDAEPRPGYQPHMKEAKILPKFRFRAWIDKQDHAWKKLDAQCIDTVSFGLVLARLHKGSRIVLEQTRVNDEVWLPRHVAVKVDARVALLKEFNVDQDTTYRDYKKFRSETKMVPVGEVQEPH